MTFYRSQTKFAKVMFLQVSVCPHWGGMHGFIRGGMCGFIRWGACVVLFEGHAWFYSGGMRGFIWGGMRGFIGGACMVLFGGHAWFYLGGMHGFIRGACVVLCRGVCMIFLGGGVCGFFSFFGYNEIRSMSGRYASYWNAFLLKHYFHFDRKRFHFHVQAAPFSCSLSLDKA